MPLSQPDPLVKRLQQNLIAQGFNPGPTDGIWGSSTCGSMCTALSMAGTSPERLRMLGGAIATELRDHNMVTPLLTSHFIAQAAHETQGFYYMYELWGPTPAQSKYEGRADLGNTQRGDGPKFKGRGLLMITGRYNYQLYGDLLDLDLVGSPDLLLQPVYAAKAAMLYWQRNHCSAPAERNDILGVSRIINVGREKTNVTPNGMPDRTAKTNKLLKLWGV